MKTEHHLSGVLGALDALNKALSLIGVGQGDELPKPRTISTGTCDVPEPMRAAQSTKDDQPPTATLREAAQLALDTLVILHLHAPYIQLRRSAEEAMDYLRAALAPSPAISVTLTDKDKNIVYATPLVIAKGDRDSNWQEFDVNGHPGLVRVVMRMEGEEEDLLLGKRVEEFLLTASTSSVIVATGKIPDDAVYLTLETQVNGKSYRSRLCLSGPAEAHLTDYHAAIGGIAEQMSRELAETIKKVSAV